MRSLPRAAAFLLAAALPLACAGRSDLEDSLADAGAEGGAPDPDGAGPPAPSVRSNKLDLLLVLDNSRYLDTAHGLLVDTLPYLLDRLARPACVNGFGTVVAETASPSDPCPVGVRDFAPLRDVHIGVISTSIGGHGADICNTDNGGVNATSDDHAHLLTRAGASGAVPTWQNKGFLFWDPGQGASPPGEADLGALETDLRTIVGGVGTWGCGFESQLESIYRFLVDPTPYLDITVQNGKAVPSGVDEVLLQQRADFLRPDSLVAVLLLTDEDDCSTREGGQYWVVNQAIGPDKKPFRMPRARSICAEDPYDPCCVSCAQTPPAGCTPAESDPACASVSSDIEDPINLRCFDQKRRFGVDFLYPTSRYVHGFTQPTVSNRDGEIVANPLFAGGRAPELFFFGGILGVPWQDLSVEPTSLAAGLLPATELDWSLLLDDPATGAPPGDPLMISSIDPREGVHPRTGDPIAPPSAGSFANRSNGHERIIEKRDDLQFTCIFPRRFDQNCVGSSNCECEENFETNPLCQATNGTYSTVQHYARAVPATRPLRVMRDLGAQAVVTSICADEVDVVDAPNFGYRPSVDALLRTIRWRLAPSVTVD